MSYKPEKDDGQVGGSTYPRSDFTMAYTSTRPRIPVGVSREVLIEAGHRCAVCGVPCPLERAHIVPWSKSKEHRVENLICLCANCHERADREDWGSLVLQKYKLSPWVMRQNGALPETIISKRVTIVIEKPFSEFGVHDEDILRHALASFLQIPVNSIRIIETEEGSVRVAIELPVDAAHRLLEAFKENDPRLKDHLIIFPLKDISLELDWENAEPLSAVDQVAKAASALETPVEAEVRRDYEERFERVFEDRYPVVLLFFARKGLATEVARDLAQETFMRLYRIGPTKSEEELDSLIFGLARQVHLEHLPTKSKDSTPLAEILARERQAVIKDVLGEFPELMRRSLTLRYGTTEANEELRKLVDATKAKLFVSRLVERKLKPPNRPGQGDP